MFGSLSAESTLLLNRQLDIGVPEFPASQEWLDESASIREEMNIIVTTWQGATPTPEFTGHYELVSSRFAMMDLTFFLWNQLAFLRLGDPRRTEILNQSIANLEQSSIVGESIQAVWETTLSSILEIPDRVIADGVYAVGSEIRLGTYRAPGSDSCYWARLSNFTGTSNILANHFGPGQVIVTIERTDVGFETSNCGTWTRIGN